MIKTHNFNNSDQLFVSAPSSLTHFSLSARRRLPRPLPLPRPSPKARQSQLEPSPHRPVQTSLLSCRKIMQSRKSRPKPGALRRRWPWRPWRNLPPSLRHATRKLWPTQLRAKACSKKGTCSTRSQDLRRARGPPTPRCCRWANVGSCSRRTWLCRSPLRGSASQWRRRCCPSNGFFSLWNVRLLPLRKSNLNKTIPCCICFILTWFSFLHEIDSSK